MGVSLLALGEGRWNERRNRVPKARVGVWNWSFALGFSAVTDGRSTTLACLAERFRWSLVSDSLHNGMGKGVKKQD